MLTKWPSLAKRSLAHTQYFISGAITTHFFKNIFVHLYGRVNGLPTRRRSLVITSPGVRKRRDIADNLPFRFEPKSNLEEQRTNSQPTPTHAGGDRKFSAARRRRSARRSKISAIRRRRRPKKIRRRRRDRRGAGL